MKETVVSSIMLRMDPYLDQNQMRELREALCIVLVDYDLSAAQKSGGAGALPAVSDADVNTRPFLMFFIAKRIEGLSPKSLRFYQLEIGAFLSFCRKPLAEIKTDDVRYYLATRGPRASKVTLDNKRRILASFFAWLAAEEYIGKNPMLKLKAIRQEKRLKKPFSEYEIECLRDACADIRELAIVDILLSTGMRCGELHGLDRRHVDLARGDLTVFGKGAKARVCYLNPKARKHLSDYLATRADAEPALIVAAQGARNRLGISGIEGLVKAIGVRAGVGDVHPHRFRRTAATLAINRGMPVEQVQQMLGHEKIETTMRYAIVARESVKLAHAKYLA